jgi:hypothetical protein
MNLLACLRPPAGWTGGVISRELEVSAGQEAAMFVAHLTAYPAGVAFRVIVLTTSSPGVLCREALGTSSITDAASNELQLYIGVEFSDGRSATRGTTWISTDGTQGLEEPSPFPKRIPPDPARDLVLNIGGAESGENEFIADCWVWPLPPSGLLRFNCGWPAAGIPMGCEEIEAEILRAAAKRAEPLWPLGTR